MLGVQYNLRCHRVGLTLLPSSKLDSQPARRSST